MWNLTFESGGRPDTSSRIVTDAKGATFVAGTFSRDVTFGNAGRVLSPRGESDGFLTKVGECAVETCEPSQQSAHIKPSLSIYPKKLKPQHLEET